MPELLHVPPTLRTLGDLVDLADKVPVDDVLPTLKIVCAKIKVLAAETPAEQAQLHRDMVFLGALANRAIFEVCDVPKDRQHVIA